MGMEAFRALCLAHLALFGPVLVPPMARPRLVRVAPRDHMMVKDLEDRTQIRDQGQGHQG